MPGGVGAHVRGTQHRAVLVEQAQPRADRCAGAAGVPGVVADERLGVPPAGAQHGRPGMPGPRGLLQLRGGVRPGTAPAQERRRQDAGVEGGCGPVRRGQRVGHLDGRAHVRGAGPPRGAPGAQHRQPSQRGPFGTALAGELPGGAPGVRQRGGGVVVEQGGLGEQEQGLRQLHAAALAGVLGDGLLGRLPGVGHQPHRQQQLTPVDQQLAEPAAVLPDAALGRGRVGERRGDLPAQPEDERQVGPGEPDRERERQLLGQPLGLAQVGLRRRELMPVGVGQAAVPDDPVDPELVAGGAQHRQRLAVVPQGVGVPAEVEQDAPALGQGAGPPDRVVERGQYQVQLAERLLGASALREQEGQGEPDLRGHRGVARRLGLVDAALQVHERAVDRAAVAQRLAPGLLGDRARDPVAVLARLPHRRGREGERLRGRGVGEPERLPRAIAGSTVAARLHPGTSEAAVSTAFRLS